MITNLLGETAQYKEFIGEIKAIYQNNDSIFFLLVTENGHILTCSANDITLVVTYYSLFIPYNSESRIRLIKILRNVLNTDLKTAKELTDQHPYLLPVKDNLTYKDAMKMKQQFTQEGFSPEIRQK